MKSVFSLLLLMLFLTACTIEISAKPTSKESSNDEIKEIPVVEDCDGIWMAVEWLDGRTFATLEELKESIIEDLPEETKQKTLDGIKKSKFIIKNDVLHTCSKVERYQPKQTQD